MAFVVGQGVISLPGRCRGWKVSGQGVVSLLGRCRGWKVSGRGDKSQIDATGLGASGQDLKFCFVFSEVRRFSKGL